MTTMLVLGGTAWLGREVAREAVAAGHDVTCLARGESGSVPDGVRLVVADRTQADAYEAVSGGDWDCVVDLARQPGQVRSAVQALADRTAHWAFVSTCSVYADHGTPGADESAELLPALAGDVGAPEQYGEAKVACELVCRAAVGDRLLVARAGLIAGYGDPSDRFGYWPARLAAAADRDPAWGPTVLWPDVPTAPTQAIDVRDLAQWLVRAGRVGTTGTYNAVGESRPFRELLQVVADVVGFEGEVEAVDADWLVARDVQEWAGPRSLPLWIADPGWGGFSARDGRAARQTGLTLRPLADLVADALRWERERGLGRERAAGLAPDDERELLAAWRSR